MYVFFLCLVTTGEVKSRLDVRKNVEAVEKQLQPVKERLEVLLSDPEFDVKGKSTEQSTEVVEKLDDEGVVMCTFDLGTDCLSPG